jgi:rhomboid protease GluP
MRAFARYENHALAIYTLTSDAPKDVWLRLIRDSGIYYWNKSIQVLDEANELEMPDMLKRRNDLLIQYCNLRIASYNYLAGKIAGTAGPGDDSVDIYNAQIADLMNSLKNDK